MKIALFDFDGTLSQGYISMEFLNFLFREGICPPDIYRQQMDLYQKAQAGKVTYEQWCDQWGRLWPLGLSGRKETVIRNLARRFFQQFRKKIYSFALLLIKFLKQQGYQCLLLTVRATEVVESAADYLAITQFYGSKVLTENGVYGDRLITDLHQRRGKQRFMRRLVQSGQYEMKTSLRSETNIILRQLINMKTPSNFRGCFKRLDEIGK